MGAIRRHGGGKIGKIQNSLKRKKIKPKSPQIQKQRALEQKKVEKQKRPKRRTLLKKRTKERRRM